MVIAAPVADRLRDDILEGAFPPGERLIELQLTERYGVGRAAIRAALVDAAVRRRRPEILAATWVARSNAKYWSLVEEGFQGSEVLDEWSAWFARAV